MRAFWDSACFWVGAVVLVLVACFLVLSGVAAIYGAGVEKGRAQGGFQLPAPTQTVAPASQPAPHQYAPAAPPAQAPAYQSPPPPQAPERLTIEVSTAGVCQIGISVPADAGQRRRFIQQRQQLGLGPCD
jgi:hypothetical protein